MAQEETIKAYKGFNKDLKCRGFQYEVGKEYELPDGQKPELCFKGFHACESPFEVFDYYLYSKSMGLARFCEVELSGVIDRSHNNGAFATTKIAASKIKIIRELSFKELIDAGVEWTNNQRGVLADGNSYVIGKEEGLKLSSSESGTYIYAKQRLCKIAASGTMDTVVALSGSCCISLSGNDSRIIADGSDNIISVSGPDVILLSFGRSAKISSSGYYTTIGSHGDNALISISGDYNTVISTGENAVISCSGIANKVKAKIGSWITLTEWDYFGGHFQPKAIKTEYVDGERIKEDAFYTIRNGEFFTSIFKS